MPGSSNKIQPSGGFLHELALRIKLILRLMADRRVNPLLKIIPIGSVLYVFNPIDVPGPLDDAAIFGLGMYLFLEFCPADVVEEHLNQLRSVNLDPDERFSDDVIVDVEFREVDQDED
jgi:hypothetical protein